MRGPSRSVPTAIDGTALFSDARPVHQSGALMTQVLFKSFEMLDPEHDELRGGYELLVEGDRIKEISARPIKAPSAAVIDCGKRTLMPGLIDSHVHVVLSEVSIPRLENVPLTL